MCDVCNLRELGLADMNYENDMTQHVGRSFDKKFTEIDFFMFNAFS